MITRILKSWICPTCKEKDNYKMQYDELIAQKEKEIDIQDKIDFYNNKYNKNTTTYMAKGGKYKFDVRNFITCPDAITLAIVAKEGLDLGTNDERADKCFKWVKDNIIYTTDKNQFKITDEWMFPAETIYNKKGDCEDGAILMLSLMRNAGVPSYRVKVVCGYVQMPGGEKIGHAYPIYLRETDDEWVILDWCYWPNTLPVKNRALAKEEEKYKSIWFTFNDKYSWGQVSFDVGNKWKQQ